MRAVFLYHLPVAIYGAAILMVSSIPNLKTPEVSFWAADKVAHLAEYAGFAYLVYRSASRLEGWSLPRQVIWPTLLFPIGLALADEYLQSFVPGRFSDLLDCLADTSGAVLVVVILWFTRWRPDRTGV